MIMTNNQGFRFEFHIPTPGNVLVVHVGQEAFHIGLYPPEAPVHPRLTSACMIPMTLVPCPRHLMRAGVLRPTKISANSAVM